MKAVLLVIKIKYFLIIILETKKENKALKAELVNLFVQKQIDKKDNDLEIQKEEESKQLVLESYEKINATG